MFTKPLMKRKRYFTPTKSMYNPECYKVGINSVLREGLLNFRPNFLETPERVVSGQLVSFDVCVCVCVCVCVRL